MKLILVSILTVGCLSACGSKDAEVAMNKVIVDNKIVISDSVVDMKNTDTLTGARQRAAAFYAESK